MPNAFNKSKSFGACGSVGQELIHVFGAHLVDLKIAHSPSQRRRGVAFSGAALTCARAPWTVEEMRKQVQHRVPAFPLPPACRNRYRFHQLVSQRDRLRNTLDNIEVAGGFGVIASRARLDCTRLHREHDFPAWRPGRVVGNEKKQGSFPRSSIPILGAPFLCEHLLHGPHSLVLPFHIHMRVDLRRYLRTRMPASFCIATGRGNDVNLLRAVLQSAPPIKRMLRTALPWWL